MKLVVNLPESLVGEIRDAVEEGGYEDAREFVTTAIQNQLQLESGPDISSFKTLDEAIQDVENSQAEPEESKPTPDADQSEPKTHVAVTKTDYSSVTPIAPPDRERVGGGPLWGQYNRMLPVKFVVRRLANELANVDSGDEPTSVPFSEFSSEVAWEARELGQNIERTDERKSRGRGEKLASGFPTGDKTEKSIDRFQTHFVGYVDQSGNLTGAPATLRFLNVTGDGPPSVGITEAGAEFAASTNPVLDRDVTADQPLSKEEVEFYINHVAEALPEELEAMVHTATAVSEGDDRPTSLTERVAELDDGWSEAQASTNRSGLVSRMYELGLVNRSRVGQRGVKYDLTDDGHDLLHSHS
jgi:Arc/MetJ-type ribon-helix-helix transcriptional regulator